MNRVYFSNKDDFNKWECPDSGTIKVFLFPTKWWSPKEWKMARMLQRDFYCTFCIKKAIGE